MSHAAVNHYAHLLSCRQIRQGVVIYTKEDAKLDEMVTDLLRAQDRQLAFPASTVNPSTGE